MEQPAPEYTMVMVSNGDPGAYSSERDEAYPNLPFPGQFTVPLKKPIDTRSGKWRAAVVNMSCPAWNYPQQLVNPAEQAQLDAVYDRLMASALVVTCSFADYTTYGSTRAKLILRSKPLGFYMENSGHAWNVRPFSNPGTTNETEYVALSQDSHVKQWYDVGPSAGVIRDVSIRIESTFDNGREIPIEPGKLGGPVAIPPFTGPDNKPTLLTSITIALQRVG